MFVMFSPTKQIDRTKMTKKEKHKFKHTIYKCVQLNGRNENYFNFIYIFNSQKEKRDKYIF